MPYCPNCGSAFTLGDRFCSACGAQLNNVNPVVTPNAVINANNVRSDYRIVLISKGTCSRTVAIDMISDLLGYTDPEAARIIDNAPMETALGLTAIQAQYISQAMTEYGMQVAIYNNDGYVDMGSRATSSVFNSDGSFLSTVASVLTGLTIGNRITNYNRWVNPAPVLFRPAYRRPAPPPSYRRRRPAPIPVVRHAAPPIPPRPVAAPRPAPTPRPMGGPAGSRPMPTPPTGGPGFGPGPNKPGGAGRGGFGPR